MAKHISRNHLVDILITFGQKRLFRQMGDNLFAEVTVLPKGYYFCAKGEAEGDERRGRTGQEKDRVVAGDESSHCPFLRVTEYCICGCL